LERSASRISDENLWKTSSVRRIAARLRANLVMSRTKEFARRLFRTMSAIPCSVCLPRAVKSAHEKDLQKILFE
jgi:hypothetical protein